MGDITLLFDIDGCLFNSGCVASYTDIIKDIQANAKIEQLTEGQKLSEKDYAYIKKIIKSIILDNNEQLIKQIQSLCLASTKNISIACASTRHSMKTDRAQIKKGGFGSDQAYYSTSLSIAMECMQEILEEAIPGKKVHLTKLLNDYLSPKKEDGSMFDKMKKENHEGYIELFFDDAKRAPKVSDETHFFESDNTKIAIYFQQIQKSVLAKNSKDLDVYIYDDFEHLLNNGHYILSQYKNFIPKGVRVHFMAYDGSEKPAYAHKCKPYYESTADTLEPITGTGPALTENDIQLIMQKANDEPEMYDYTKSDYDEEKFIQLVQKELKQREPLSRPLAALAIVGSIITLIAGGLSYLIQSRWKKPQARVIKIPPAETIPKSMQNHMDCQPGHFWKFCASFGDKKYLPEYTSYEKINLEELRAVQKEQKNKLPKIEI